MSGSSSTPRVIIWTDAPRAATVQQVLKHMDAAVFPVGVGGPRVAEINQLAKQFNCPHEDDLRKLLVEVPASFIVLATARDVEAEDLAYANASDTVILTFEPIWADLDQLAQSNRTGKGKRQPIKTGPIVHLPRFDHCLGWASAADPMAVLGTPRLAAFSTYGGPNSPSLFARLYDAWQILRQLAPLPESVDASLISRDKHVPDSLPQMTGHLAVHARLTDGEHTAAAVIDASDQIPAESRQLRLVANKGQLHVNDDSYALHNEQGHLLDNLAPPSPRAEYARLIALQWQRILEMPPKPDSNHYKAEDCDLLACCLACLLSARTRQPESPRKLLELHALT